MEKKARIEHELDKCIGCSACSALAPKYWKMEQGSAVCLNENIEEEDYLDNLDAANACPVNIIHIIKDNKKVI